MAASTSSRLRERFSNQGAAVREPAVRASSGRARARAAEEGAIVTGRAQGVRAARLLVAAALFAGGVVWLLAEGIRQSLHLRRYALCLVALMSLGAVPAASALGSIDFATHSGQFALTQSSLDFGSDLTITSATNNAGAPDPTVIGLRASLDPVLLTGAYTDYGPYIRAYAVNTSVTYHLRLHGTGGGPEIDAIYDPGDFLVILSTAVLSPSDADGLLGVTNLAPGSHAAYDALAQGAGWDFSATLSAAGQDIKALLAANQTVRGSVSGNVTVVAVAVPEPASLVLLAGGLAGLGWLGGRRRV